MKVIWVYQGIKPIVNDGCILHNSSWVIGNVNLGKKVELRSRSVLRGDGKDINVGNEVTFLPRSTVHIANDFLGTEIGDFSIVGRYSLVHACTIGQSVLIGDQAVIMDGTVLGNNILVAANSLIPPGKKFPDNTIISGSPGKIVGSIDSKEIRKYREEILNNNSFSTAILRSRNEGDDPLAELDVTPWKDFDIGEQKISDKAFVAPDALIRGKIRVEDRASIWFATILASRPSGSIKIGEGTNIQDNTIIDTGNNSLKIGKRVTVGHNVRLGACDIGDDCLIGMGSTIEDGVIIDNGAFVGARSLVKKGTIVKSNMIYAGRPAKYFRQIRGDEYRLFGEGQKGYERFAKNYLNDYKKKN